MPLEIDFFAQLIKVTSPTVEVDAQVLHDFVEDQMAWLPGILHSDILQPEGKIEDPVNPGVFSQIILVFNSPWQIQFWPGSGYTRIHGGKIVGGLNDQVIKATGAAGDITVLESPVDGITVVTGSALTTPQADQLKQAWQILRGKNVINRLTSELEVYDEFGALLYTAPIWEDAAGTIPVTGTSEKIDRRDRLT